MYTTVCLQVDPLSSSQTYRSYSSVIIAARDADINVHTVKAVPNSGIAFLALALRQRTTRDAYDHYVPGCNGTARSFYSVIAVYDDTSVLVERFTSTIGEQPDVLDYFSLKVCIDASVHLTICRGLYVFPLSFLYILTPILKYLRPPRSAPSKYIRCFVISRTPEIHSDISPTLP